MKKIIRFEMSTRDVDEERIKELANSIAENESKIDILAREYNSISDQLANLNMEKESVEIAKNELEEHVEEQKEELRELEDTLDE